jgi:hypothetical protein
MRKDDPLENAKDRLTRVFGPWQGVRHSPLSPPGHASEAREAAGQQETWSWSGAHAQELP